MVRRCQTTPHIRRSIRVASGTAGPTSLKYSSYFTAVAALNAIDALGDIAKPAHTGLKTMPTVDPRVKRARTYIQRL
ncbi:MAG: hypothetical protein ACE5KM_21400, partial [Planctomycetaceae bacterium]